MPCAAWHTVTRVDACAGTGVLERPALDRQAAVNRCLRSIGGNIGGNLYIYTFAPTRCGTHPPILPHMTMSLYTAV